MQRERALAEPEIGSGKRQGQQKRQSGAGNTQPDIGEKPAERAGKAKTRQNGKPHMQAGQGQAVCESGTRKHIHHGRRQQGAVAKKQSRKHTRRGTSVRHGGEKALLQFPPYFCKSGGGRRRAFRLRRGHYCGNAAVAVPGAQEYAFVAPVVFGVPKGEVGKKTYRRKTQSNLHLTARQNFHESRIVLSQRPDHAAPVHIGLRHRRHFCSVPRTPGATETRSVKTIRSRPPGNGVHCATRARTGTAFGRTAFISFAPPPPSWPPCPEENRTDACTALFSQSGIDTGAGSRKAA